MATPLTADFDSPIKNIRALNSYPIDTGSTYYKGQLIQLVAGKAKPAVAGDTSPIVGRYVSTSPDGTQVTVEEGDIVLNTVTTAPTADLIGGRVYAASDNEVNTTNTNAIAGILVGIVSATQALVRCTLEACQS